MALGLVGASAPAAVGTARADVVDVAGVDVPVLATFAVSYGGGAGDRTVGGVVHGVRRVEGATVLYLSLGLPADDSRTAVASGLFDSRQGYASGAISDITLVDRPGLTAYRPLMGEEAYSTLERDVSLEPDELAVVWVAFPELPPDVEQVDVLIGKTLTPVPAIAVEDGALTPTVDDPAPLVGEGWPEVAQQASLAQVDPQRSIRPMTAHRESTDDTTQLAETSEQVDATLAADVLFDKSSAALSPAAQQALATLAADIAARGQGEVVVVGHTDSDGSDQSNQLLSEQRAAGVVAALQPLAGGAVTFAAQGRGESEPLVSNSSPENMQLNRRVTVTYQVKDGGR